MAGDTVDAAAVAGHLAACPDCTAELGRLRRTAAILRDVVPSEAPVELPPDLRERTLAYVRELGVPRPAVAAVGAGDVIAFPVGERTRAEPRRPRSGPGAFRHEPECRGPSSELPPPAVWATLAAATSPRSRHDDAFTSRSNDEAASPDGRQLERRHRAARMPVSRASDLNAGPAAGVPAALRHRRRPHVIADPLPWPRLHEYRCWFETSAAGRRSADVLRRHRVLVRRVGGQGDPGRSSASRSRTPGLRHRRRPRLIGTL
jgi:hypothetical protein